MSMITTPEAEMIGGLRDCDLGIETVREKAALTAGFNGEVTGVRGVDIMKPSIIEPPTKLAIKRRW